METMERFATFVLEGSNTAPVEKKGRVASFVNRNGAIGCGYYHCTNRTGDNCASVTGADYLACPSVSPYVIATVRGRELKSGRMRRRSRADLS